MSIRLSNLPLAANSIVPSGFFAVADLTDLSSTQGMGRTINIPVSGIYNISTGKNIDLKTTDYTISKHDYKTNIIFNHTNGIKTLTVPINTTERINVGYNINIIRNNNGAVQILPDNGVNIYSESGFYLKNRYSVATLTKIEQNSWILTGDLTKTS